jgi:crotonobetainyl-CoA:carnitine CoA-transferase CaiB-like acyl-CoA transferase
LLAQLGADVIKIEPIGGDPTRTMVRGGPGGTFIAYSRGKKSVCIDLGTAEGHAAFAKLLATTDVIVHNLAPHSARRLKVTYEGCYSINPNVVYCHIKGYGPGPLEDELASNPIVEASTGVMFEHRIDARPSRLGPSYHDQFAGAYAVIGILGALLQKDSSNESRHLEIGLYETGLHVAARELVGVQLKTHLLGRPESEPSGEFSFPGYGAYESSDGRWVYLVMLSDNHWSKFCEAMLLPEAGDASLATVRQRKKQRERVEALVKAAIRTLPFDTVADRLKAAGLGFTEVLSPAQVLDVPQARYPGKLKVLSFQGLQFFAPNFPLCALTDTNPELPPPLLGEHTNEVLDSLGYGPVEREHLSQRGIVGTASSGRHTWTPVKK